MGRVRFAALRLAVSAVVTLVGTGACAFGPPRDDPGAGGSPTGDAVGHGSDGGRARRPGRANESTPTGFHAGRRRGVPAADLPAGRASADVEAYLAKIGGFGPVTVDGKQSAADCAAIKKFQKRYGISPPEGRAGPTTVDVARRVGNTDHRVVPGGHGTTSFCVDLTQQTVWVMNGGKVVLGPTVTRTGMAGYRTPGRHLQGQLPQPEGVVRPVRGVAAVLAALLRRDGLPPDDDVHPQQGHRLARLRQPAAADAKAMWDLGAIGTRVYLFGRRPGT